MIGPFASAIAGPVAAAITQAGEGGQSLESAIRALFAKYSAFGGMWDFTDSSTLFQAAALTTPVTASGQSVWSVADISGHGNHLTTYNASTRPQFNGAGITPDGVDDFLVTAANLDMSACDKVVVAMGYEKLDDAALMQMESSYDAPNNPGTFYCVSGNDIPLKQSMKVGGTLSGSVAGFSVARPDEYGAHIGRGSIPGDLTEAWWNGTKGNNDTSDKGTGNFGAYPLYLLSRAGSSLFSNTPARRALVLGVPVAGVQVSDEDIELIRLWLMEGAV